MTIAKLDYEEKYHATRHASHLNPDYYEARARIALNKFFKGLPKEAKLLDFGCGMGQNILKRPNSEGYDISEFALDHCRSKGIKVTNSLEVLLDDGYDVVFSAHVLEHHPNPKQMVEDMKKKLKPGGKLLLVIPYERHGKSHFELDLNQHLFSWNFRSINNLLITSGFKIIKNKYLRGAGYEKLLPLYRLNFNLYAHSTHWLSRIWGIKELMVVAEKSKS